MNRDESTEEKEETEEAKTAEVSKPEKKLDIMTPNAADVDFRKRMSITRAAKRFERYGHVQDGQDLVSLIGDVAKIVDGKATHVVAPRHRKGAGKS